MKTIVLALSLAMYVLVMAFPLNKAWISLAAAAVVIAAGAVGPWQALVGLINWNVLMIYAGCLILADLFIYSGVPAHVADRIVEKSPTLGIAIVAILVLTGIISAFVENVATVLVMAPIAIQISRRLKIDPAPFMIGLAVMANLQGTATLVGDPPSMIFASYAGYTFNDFFFHAGRVSIFFAVQAGAAAGALYFFGYFRRLPRTDVGLPMTPIVSLVPAALLILMVAGLAAASFLSAGGMHVGSGLLCLGLGLAGLAWFVLLRREPPDKAWKMVRELDWQTILFLIGIFIVIGAIGAVGLLDDLTVVMARLIGKSELTGFLVIVSFSVLVSGFVDNVPYIIAMLPVADKLARSLQLNPELFMFGLLIGSCLGGNLTPFGASANIVAVGIVRKEGRHLGFIEWIKIGIPFTALTTAASALLVYLVWR